MPIGHQFMERDIGKERKVILKRGFIIILKNKVYL